MNTTAVVFTSPGHLALQSMPLVAPDGPHALVDVNFSGISTGTERLLWSGDMPAFPGMGYPLVPGYETVGRIERSGLLADRVHDEHRRSARTCTCVSPPDGVG